MQQQTFAEVTFEQYRKPTRRERFLDEMNRVVPWTEWWPRLSPSIPRPRGQGALRWASNACCVCIVCNSGSTCRIRRSRRPCRTPAPCDSLSALI